MQDTTSLEEEMPLSKRQALILHMAEKLDATRFIRIVQSPEDIQGIEGKILLATSRGISYFDPYKYEEGFTEKGRAKLKKYFGQRIIVRRILENCDVPIIRHLIRLAKSNKDPLLWASEYYLDLFARYRQSIVALFIIENIPFIDDDPYYEEIKEIVDMLLYAYHVKKKNINWKSPKFYDAVRARDEILMDEFLTDVNESENRKRYILELAECDQYKSLREKIKSGVTFKRLEIELLLDATCNNDVKMLKYLVENGADIHALQDYAVRWATSPECFDALRYLVEQGANIHAMSEHALETAIQNYNHDAAALFLLKHGANPNIRPGWACSHYTHCLKKGNFKMFSALLDFGGTPSKKDLNDILINVSDLDALKFLFEKGFRPENGDEVLSKNFIEDKEKSRFLFQMGYRPIQEILGDENYMFREGWGDYSFYNRTELGVDACLEFLEHYEDPDYHIEKVKTIKLKEEIPGIEEKISKFMYKHKIICFEEIGYILDDESEEITLCYPESLESEIQKYKDAIIV